MSIDGVRHFHAIPYREEVGVAFTQGEQMITAQNDAARVMDGLRRIVQAVRASSAVSAKTSGLTSAQVLILKTIDSETGLSINDLATRTLTHQSTVSEVVGRLETRGLVLREKAADDGRRRELRLTDLGRQHLQYPSETIQEVFIEAMKQLHPENLATLADGLEALVAAARLAPSPAPMFLEDDLTDLKPETTP